MDKGRKPQSNFSGRRRPLACLSRAGSSRAAGRVEAWRRLSRRLRGAVADFRREERLWRAREREVRGLFDRLPVGLYRTTVDGRILDVNPALMQILAVSDRRRLLECNVLDFYGQAGDRAAWQRRIEHDGVARRVELQLRRGDGVEIWVRDSGRAVRGRDGKTLFYEGCIEDVTGDREVRERLRQVFDRFRELQEIIDRSPVVVFRWRPQQAHRMDFVSGSVRRLGYVPEDFTVHHRDWLSLVHPEDREPLEEELADFANGADSTMAATFRFRHGDGGYRWVEDAIFATRHASGKAEHLEGILVDVTDRRELQKQLLETASREQRRIGRDLHDVLGQNLTAAAFLTAALAHEAEQDFPRLVEPVARIGELVNQAIAQTRMLARGLCPVELENHGLRQGLEELASSTRELVQVECTLDCDDDFAQNDSLLATHFYYIAREAVTNAIKHASPNSIRILLWREGRRIGMAVEDDGLGFDLGQRRKQRRALGLSLMKHRAEAVGGRLRVDSRPGRGTRVEVRAGERRQ